MKKDKVIHLDSAPIKERSDGGLVLDLGVIVMNVLYEHGLISWEEYASAVPPEFRPAKFRKRPRSTKAPTSDDVPPHQ